MVRASAFEVYPDVTGRYRWRFWGKDGRLQADSAERYQTAAAACDAARRLRTEVERARVVVQNVQTREPPIS
jgi:uncharacterized protein YegP (UPF0339 family)